MIAGQRSAFVPVPRGRRPGERGTEGLSGAAPESSAGSAARRARRAAAGGAGGVAGCGPVPRARRSIITQVSGIRSRWPGRSRAPPGALTGQQGSGAPVQALCLATRSGLDDHSHGSTTAHRRRQPDPQPPRSRRAPGSTDGLAAPPATHRARRYVRPTAAGIAVA